MRGSSPGRQHRKGWGAPEYVILASIIVLVTTGVGSLMAAVFGQAQGTPAAPSATVTLIPPTSSAITATQRTTAKGQDSHNDACYQAVEAINNYLTMWKDILSDKYTGAAHDRAINASKILMQLYKMERDDCLGDG